MLTKRATKDKNGSANEGYWCKCGEVESTERKEGQQEYDAGSETIGVSLRAAVTS